MKTRLFDGDKIVFDLTVQRENKSKNYACFDLQCIGRIQNRKITAHDQQKSTCCNNNKH